MEEQQTCLSPLWYRDIFTNTLSYCGITFSFLLLQCDPLQTLKGMRLILLSLFLLKETAKCSKSYLVKIKDGKNLFEVYKSNRLSWWWFKLAECVNRNGQIWILSKATAWIWYSIWKFWVIYVLVSLVFHVFSTEELTSHCKNSDFGRLSFFIDFFVGFHIVWHRYTSEYADFTF